MPSSGLSAMATRRFSIPEGIPGCGDWHQSAFKWMGGALALSGPTRSDLEWVKAVENGLPTEALESAVEQGVLSWQDVQEYVIPRRTLSRRKERGHSLTPDESDRLLRLLRVIAKAEDTFQNEEKARRWLRKPNRALGGDVPLELLRTESGARLVKQIIGRIAHGVYS